MKYFSPNDECFTKLLNLSNHNIKLNPVKSEITTETTFNLNLLNTLTIPPHLIENSFENLNVNKKHWITHGQYNAVISNDELNK